VEAVKEGRVDHRGRERREQVTRLDERVHRLVDIADEDHRGVGAHGVAAPCEGALRLKKEEGLPFLHAWVIINSLLQFQISGAVYV